MSDEISDALHAVDTFTGLINNADIKAGFVAAAVGVIGGAVAQQRDLVRLTFRGVSAPDQPLLRILLIALGISVTVALVAVGFALKPRTPKVGAPSRFSFLTVAESSWRPPTSRGSALSEGWTQARTLARIVKRKYTALKWCIVSMAIAYALFCAWLLTATLA